MRALLLTCALCFAACGGAGSVAEGPDGPQRLSPTPKNQSPKAQSGPQKSEPTRSASAQLAKAAAPKPVLGPGDFFGASYPPEQQAQGAHGRIGSLNWGTWIQPKPDSNTLPLGGIRIGASIPVTGEPVNAIRGRCRSFVPVERGYVCVGKRSTRDMSSAFMKAHRWSEPAPGAFPYEYAFSVGAPMLTRLPATEKERKRWHKTGDRDHRRLRGWEVGHDELTQDELIQPNGDVPDFLQNGGHAPTPWTDTPHIFFKKIPFGSMLAYTRAFEVDGTTYVLSTNMTVVPAQGLKRFRPSAFHGVELNETTGLQLPIAWMRKKARPKYRRAADGSFEESGEAWPKRGWVALTGVEEKDGKRRFLETREPGTYILSADATVARHRHKLPYAVRKKPQKWIHIRVTQGTMTLYENETPVFTTLMSPGKEGASPYGTYRIESKHHVSTMTTEMGEPKKFWIADVPWTMYFKRPYAIHGAYWHEDFGEKKSGGCINLSPLDAKHVFDWADPKLPEGWGMAQGYTMGGGTVVLVEG